jgi:hypothetical protein
MANTTKNKTTEKETGKERQEKFQREGTLSSKCSMPFMMEKERGENRQNLADIYFGALGLLHVRGRCMWSAV